MIVYQVQCDGCRKFFKDADGIEYAKVLKTLAVDQGVFVSMDSISKEIGWKLVTVSLGSDGNESFMLCDNCYERFLSINSSLFFKGKGGRQ